MASSLDVGLVQLSHMKAKARPTQLDNTLTNRIADIRSLARPNDIALLFSVKYAIAMALYIMFMYLSPP